MARIRQTLLAVFSAALLAYGASRAEAQGAVSDFPLRPSGAATLLRASASPGEDFVSVPVTYAHTGSLSKPVQKPYGFLGEQPIPAGTPVFALPTSLPSGLEPHPNWLWCALETHGAGSPKQTYTVACFPKRGKTYYILPLGGYLFPAHFGLPYLSNMIAAPEITEQPVDVRPPLTLSLRFSRNLGGFAYIQIVVHQPGSGFQLNGPVFDSTQVIAANRIPLSANGIANLRVFGGELVLKASANGRDAEFSLERPFSAPTSP